MDDCVFRFRLERDGDPVPRTSEYSWSLDGDGQPLDNTPFMEALIEGGWPVPSAPVNRSDGKWQFTGQVVAAAGVLGYTQTEPDGSRRRHSNPARILFEICRFQESVGGGFATAAAPPTWTYQMKLWPEGRDYSAVLPISHALTPGEADRFLVTIAADESSLHHFNLSLGYLGGGRVDCGPVALELFVPTERWLFEPH